MTFEDVIIQWLPLWIPLTIIFTGGLIWYKLRKDYKIEQMKMTGKIKKREETLEGGIEKLIDSAPENLKQIESEIATLKSKGATPDMLKRLESERDMLLMATKYGDLAKPLLKPLGGIVNKILGGLGNG